MRKKVKHHNKINESHINQIVRMVVKHLKGDIHDFKEEADEDRGLIKRLKKKDPPKRAKRKHSRSKIATVMEEFKQGKLHSGSKKGPKVRSRKQAIAIALSEARRKKAR
jgi:Family of unknown function (DUF6496)